MSKRADGFSKRGAIWWTRLQGRRVSTGCKDLEAAKLWRAEQERRLADPAYAATRATTVRDVIADFLRSRKVAGRADDTIVYYRKVLGHTLRFYDNGETRLSELSLERTEQYIAQRTEETAGSSTISKELKGFKACLRVAHHAGKYAGDIARLFPLHFSAKGKVGERYLERTKLWDLLRALQPHRAAFVAVAIATGARHSEVESVLRNDVNFSKGEILIRGTKTEESWRTIPILPHARELLVYALERGTGTDGRLVEEWAYSNLNQTCHRACKRIDHIRLSANDFRRTLATWLIQDGVPPHLVAFLLGHTSSAMVEKVYGRMTPAAAGALIAAIVGEKGCVGSVPVSPCKALSTSIPWTLNTGDSCENASE